MQTPRVSSNFYLHLLQYVNSIKQLSETELFEVKVLIKREA